MTWEDVGYYAIMATVLASRTCSPSAIVASGAAFRAFAQS